MSALPPEADMLIVGINVCSSILPLPTRLAVGKLLVYRDNNPRPERREARAFPLNRLNR